MRPFEWQPVTGCSPASPGCANCYAMKLAGEELADHPSRSGLTIAGRGGPVWSGEVRFNPGWLDAPARIVGRRVVAVCPHGDLFHEAVPTGWIDQVFAVMECCSQHLFHLLTKRAERMRAYTVARYGIAAAPPHILFGVSAERQIEADQRIPALLATPARTRFVTLFPLLGPVSIAHHLVSGGILMVNAGQERERPAEAAWFEALAAECSAVGLPFEVGDRLDGACAADEVERAA